MKTIDICIVGGTLNDTLYSWCDHLGIKEFIHVEVPDLTDITQDNIKVEAIKLATSVLSYWYVISIGNVAHRLLDAAYILHGRLPATSTEDKIVVMKSIDQCRFYLIERNFYRGSTLISR